MKSSSKLKLKIESIAFLMLLIFVNVFAFAAENAEEPDFVFARKAFNDGFYDLAKDRLEFFLRSYPDTARLYEIHNLLGRCYYNQDNLARALYEFDLVLDTPEGSVFQDEAAYWSAEIYLKNGDSKKALEFYQKVIDDFPSSKYLPYALYSKGWTYYKLGSLEDALVCCLTKKRGRSSPASLRRPTTSMT